jgi:RNA recognition motif-containing protein
MKAKLYVGNLSFDTQDSDLRTLFAASGNVETVNVIKDRETGRAKGFGFIEMSSKEDADQAIEDMNGKEFMGRNIKVNIANDAPAKPRSSFRNY